MKVGPISPFLLLAYVLLFGLWKVYCGIWLTSRLCTEELAI
jgi:hypothetical protein